MTVGTHRRCRPLPYGRRPVFRVHVGLEEVEDLKADLRQAMVYLQE
jgi:cystathionine beta-lyase/cystathionine gamma-synthase